MIGARPASQTDLPRNTLRRNPLRRGVARRRLTLGPISPAEDRAVTAIPPFNLHAWIASNRDKLQPPVGNFALWDTGGFLVMVIG
ncbi:MAG: hypothetical protein K1X57_12015, partial [Gemmataceae bacterium]|nr:hypothetical protein [Gemmataceae bacterium]